EPFPPIAPLASRTGRPPARRGRAADRSASRGPDARPAERVVRRHRPDRLRGPVRPGQEAPHDRGRHRHHDARPAAASPAAPARHGHRLLAGFPAPEPVDPSGPGGAVLAVRPPGRGRLPAGRLGNDRPVLRLQEVHAPSTTGAPRDPGRDRQPGWLELPEWSCPGLRRRLRCPGLPRQRPDPPRRAAPGDRRHPDRSDRPGRPEPDLSRPPLVHRRAGVLPARNVVPARTDRCLPPRQGLALRADL
ncbi:MAG: hypothetical protein AVDCRST_MAG33-1919, partial [uncultured Thermomicrobiales bacterium]